MSMHSEVVGQDKRRRGGGRVVAALLTGCALSAGLSLAGASVASAATARCGGSSPKLTVHGYGSATGTPNQLILTADVNQVGGSAQAALSADNLSTAAVLAALTKASVPKRDLQTTGLNIQPNYNYVHGTAVISNYSVANTIQITLNAGELSSAGSLIDAVSAAGGNALQIQSLSFSMADPRNIEDRARQDAVTQAVAHARSMASAAGESLAGICSIADDSSIQPTPVLNGFASAGLSAASPQATSTPIEAGTEQQSAQVTLVYALRPAPPRPSRPKKR